MSVEVRSAPFDAPHSLWHRRSLHDHPLSGPDVARVRGRAWLAVRSLASCYDHRSEDGDTVSQSAENPTRSSRRR
jgi:hypothetical protein